MERVQKQTVIVAVEQKNGVVQRIGKSAILQPVVRFGGGSMKWYEDTPKRNGMKNPAAMDKVVIQFPIYCYDREFDIMLDSRDKEKAEQIMDIAYNEWVNNPEQLGDWCLEEYISHRLECDDIDFDFVPAE